MPLPVPAAILLVTLGAAVLIGCLGRRSGRGAAILALLALAASAVLAVGAGLSALSAEGNARAFWHVFRFADLEGGRTTFALAILLDGPGSAFAASVGILGLIVFAASIRGAESARSAPVFALRMLFCVSLFGVAFAGNLLVLFMAWSLSGLAAFWMAGCSASAASSGDGTGRPGLPVAGWIGDAAFLAGLAVLYAGMASAIAVRPVLGRDPFEFSAVLEAIRTAAFDRSRLDAFGLSLSGRPLVAAAFFSILLGMAAKAAAFVLRALRKEPGAGGPSGFAVAAALSAAGGFAAFRILPMLVEVPLGLPVAAAVGGGMALLLGLAAAHALARPSAGSRLDALARCAGRCGTAFAAVPSAAADFSALAARRLDGVQDRILLGIPFGILPVVGGGILQVIQGVRVSWAITLSIGLLFALASDAATWMAGALVGLVVLLALAWKRRWRDAAPSGPSKAGS